MTNKEQIIIDGIQYNKFGGFYVDYDLNGKFLSISSSAKEYKILKSLIEQLARKSQECEQKEKELLSNEKIINKLMKEVDELKQECDTLKSQLDFEVQQKECIEQECEELKRKLSNQEQLYQNEIEIYNESCLQLRQENDDLYLERLALNTANSGINSLLEIKEQENDRYHKALEEIEKVINNILNSCLGRNTVGCRPAHNVCGDLIKILDIINKVKGEGNE